MTIKIITFLFLFYLVIPTTKIILAVLKISFARFLTHYE